MKVYDLAARDLARLVKSISNQEQDLRKFKQVIQEEDWEYFYYFPDLWARYVDKRLDARSHQIAVAFRQLQSGHRPAVPERPMRAIREPSPPYSTSEQPMQQTPPVVLSPATHQEPAMLPKYEGPKQLMRSKYACIPKSDHQWGGTLRRNKMKGHPRTLASSRTSHCCSASNSESSDAVEGVNRFEEDEE